MIDVLIIPTPKETIIFHSKEQVYKSALEIILALCKNHSVYLTDIQAVCETVLKEQEEVKNEHI